MQEEYEHEIHEPNEPVIPVVSISDLTDFQEQFDDRYLIIEVGMTMDTVQKAYLFRVYEDSEQNVNETAKITGLSVKTVYNLLYKYGFKTKKESVK